MFCVCGLVCFVFELYMIVCILDRLKICFSQVDVLLATFTLVEFKDIFQLCA